MSNLYVDGVSADLYLRDVITKGSVSGAVDPHRFWSSQDLSPVNIAPMRDVAQYEFSGLRLVNSIHFEVSRFPCEVRAEYWHPLTNRWTPLREQIGKVTTIDPAYDVAEQRAAWEGEPVSFSVLDSSPAVIDQSEAILRSGVHPQHFGSRHWVPVKWKTAPVTTKSVRLIITRLPLDAGRVHPVGPNGHYVPYSVALRNLQIGCRIDAVRDVPDAGLLEEFSTSTDLMGSRVTYRLKKYEPSHATGRVSGLHWRSEPQPVNYAVVNFYADVRDETGQAQVIDRFYIDPLTVGPVLNLYYTEDDPDADFEADDTHLTYPVVEQHGESQVLQRHLQSGAATGLSFSEAAPSYLQVDNGYLQWDQQHPWWVGMNLRLDAVDGTHPWLAWAGNTLRQNGRAVEFVTADGTSLSLPIDQASDSAKGAEIQVVLAYVPHGRFSTYAASGTLTLMVRHEYDRQQVTLAVAPEALGARPDRLYVGRYSTGGTAGVPAFTLRGLVLKVEEPQTGYLEGYLSNPDLFVLKDAAQGAHDFTLNALLRMHPSVVHEDFPGGLIGGPGDRYEDVEWTPISRDYTLRQGFLRFPATRAKHFKFEFTNLVYEPYDSLVPINRKVRLFPIDLVLQHEQYWGTDPVSPLIMPSDRLKTASEHFDYVAQAPGVQTMMDITDVGRYESAVQRLRVIASDMTERGSGTEAYVADHPKVAERLAETGWVWSFTPWHIGPRAPRWQLRQRHRYETVSVEHKTRTGFFVGLRTVEAHRVDYLTDDDTDIYHEGFVDDRHIDSVSSMDTGEGRIASLSSNAEVVSKILPSVREVRAVQFATIQSDNIPLLPDDGFVADDLAEHWLEYGDATLERRSGEGVVVNRGYFARTWGMLHGQTYADLESQTYASLETGRTDGAAGGGIRSQHVSGSPSGRIYAASRVVPLTSMAGPVRLEIVSVTTGRVLAVDEEYLTAGEETVLLAAYQVGTALDVTTWGDLDGQTYASLESQTYADLQDDPIGGPVYARLYQASPSQDKFLVERLSLFDAPISWQFSVDGGATWFDALDTRNNPEAVLSFPVPGKQLRWRARLFHRDAEISSLTIRPWYGGLVGAIGRSATDFVGPNRSVLDDYPDTVDDPMWAQSHGPIPGWWFQRDVANPFGAPPNRPVGGTIMVPYAYADPSSPLPTPTPEPPPPGEE